MRSEGAAISRRAFLAPAALALLGTGCNSWPHLRDATGGRAHGPAAAAAPTAADLVAYVNANASRIQSLECRDVDLDCSQRLQSFGLRGPLACQKPRDFRMNARVGGNTEVDLGSNDHEFWYWIRRADPPYLFHCSHEDFARGLARMPFPFQPDWIMEALGMAELDPNKEYKLVAHPGRFELVENATSPQGQPVRKVIVFNRAPSSVQVTAYLLQDAKGNEICSAHVTETQMDRASGAVIPRRIQLSWPAEHVKLKMKLDDVLVNQPIDANRKATLFARPNLRDVRSYDLARGIDQGNGLRQTGVR
jgi:hypothetical protein